MTVIGSTTQSNLFCLYDGWCSRSRTSIFFSIFQHLLRGGLAWPERAETRQQERFRIWSADGQIMTYPTSMNRPLACWLRRDGAIKMMDESGLCLGIRTKTGWKEGFMQYFDIIRVGNCVLSMNNHEGACARYEDRGVGPDMVLIRSLMLQVARTGPSLMRRNPKTCWRWCARIAIPWRSRKSSPSWCEFVYKACL